MLMQTFEIFGRTRLAGTMTMAGGAKTTTDGGRLGSFLATNPTDERMILPPATQFASYPAEYYDIGGAAVGPPPHFQSSSRVSAISKLR